MHSEYPELTEENNAIIPTLKNKLLKSRSIIITGEINQQLAEKVISQLFVLQEVNMDPIKIFINSQGGHVEAGDTLHDMIKFIKPEVIMIDTGWVASAGITIIAFSFTQTLSFSLTSKQNPVP
ncbi:ATP-dependent Clp protease proteolytic subunit [Xenorhabdus bovienii]|uniref:ATP-dependent Clp protease proteolytic subunit n=1 Tax=Xenorhabdus bovienii TaxID=40576 RepID=A0AAJ1J943_XENBV|nr:ATP-dependent Clp protease proteolytic subunit [Xenorhabdus bovienii]MDE1491612.1 ATP-dependent Clp protease proteolytic subunit [Xenorhabdus bovienii]MDE9510157.1 ATP-dependent Clp protease proteolytic subunit [Xenorhabdus bovienii]MDE9521798.1 ATP-dependent Clp protease proteolytic subunit [Xenorhabdus bovienii]